MTDQLREFVLALDEHIHMTGGGTPTPDYTTGARWAWNTATAKQDEVIAIKDKEIERLIAKIRAHNEKCHAESEVSSGCHCYGGLSPEGYLIELESE